MILRKEWLHGIRRDLMVCSCGNRYERRVVIHGMTGYYVASDENGGNSLICNKCGAVFPKWNMEKSKMEYAQGLVIWDECV